MHTYEPLWTDDQRTWKYVGGEPVRGVEDIARAAPHDPGFGRTTYPETLHLDAEGRFRCYMNMSSFEGLRRWEADLRSLDDAWDLGAGRRCGANWLIIESRQRWMHDGPSIDERDARAFLTVKKAMAEVGMNILDVIIANDQNQWWSLHELTMGTTEWSFVPRLIRRQRHTFA